MPPRLNATRVKVRYATAAVTDGAARNTFEITDSVQNSVARLLRFLDAPERSVSGTASDSLVRIISTQRVGNSIFRPGLNGILVRLVPCTAWPRAAPLPIASPSDLAEITVTAPRPPTAREVAGENIKIFVDSHSEPKNSGTGTLSRWKDPVCVKDRGIFAQEDDRLGERHDVRHTHFHAVRRYSPGARRNAVRTVCEPA